MFLKINIDRWKHEKGENMKRLITYLMAGVLSVSLLTGCGGADNTDDSQQVTQENSQESTEAEIVYPIGELMTPASAFAGGNGSKESPYEISTAEELYRMASIINGYELGADKSYYVLTSDIVINDVSGYANWETEAPKYGWEPINSFQGNFNGNGHSIIGLYCFVSGEDSTVGGGLFDNISGGTVENVIIDKAMVIHLTTAQYAGILASSVYDGEVYNCQVSGVVKSSRSGGVIGHTSWSVVDGCSFDGEVRGEQGGYCGGIIGSASGVIVSNCNNKGSIASTDEKSTNVGGIVGSFSAADMGFSLVEEAYPEEVAKTEAWIQSVKKQGVGIKNCTNQGDVSAKEGFAGGIAGDISDGLGHEYRDVAVISNCVNEGNISGEGTAICSIGGICGWYATSPAIWEENVVTGAVKFENCTNKGIVTSIGAMVAGILGGANIEKGTIMFENCSDTGVIVAELEEVDGFNTNVGGIAGSVYVFEESELRFENCMTESEIHTKKATYVGGIVGSIAVAESKEGELTCIFNNCQSNGSLSVDDYATCGSICGSFMKGVKKDDFAGKMEVKNCTSTTNLPEFGTEGSIVEYKEAFEEALENEKKMEPEE